MYASIVLALASVAAALPQQGATPGVYDTPIGGVTKTTSASTIFVDGGAGQKAPHWLDTCNGGIGATTPNGAIQQICNGISGYSPNAWHWETSGDCQVGVWISGTPVVPDAIPPPTKDQCNQDILQPMQQHMAVAYSGNPQIFRGSINLNSYPDGGNYTGSQVDSKLASWIMQA